MSPRIAGCMMLKNEHLRILTTLKSLAGYVSGLIVFDTGSTDNTIEIVSNWCNDNNVQFHLTQGEFKDFSFSRNQLFDFADTIPGYDYLLLLDCNDELQGGEMLLKECQKYMDSPHKVFMVRQRWLSGNYVNKYLNARLVKTNHGWRYKKRVHEYLCHPESQDPKTIVRPSISEDVILYQNRNEDDDKSAKRFARDKVFLMEDVKQFNDPRDIFYLAQTLACLGENEESLNYYQKRAEIVEGFWEERFHSYLRSGEIYLRMNDIDMAAVNFFKACMIDCRVEPLVHLARIYTSRGDHLTAYLLLRISINLEYPHNNILFISEQDYIYDRWQQHSIVSYYVGRYTEGRRSLEIAKATGRDMDSHAQNEEFYRKAESEGKKDTEFFLQEELPDELKEINDSFMRDAKVALNEGDIDTAITKFIKSFQLTRSPSPLLMLAEYCRLIKANRIAYYFVKITMELAPLPSEKNKRILMEYSYSRYHLLGILGFYNNDFIDGKAACIRAIKEGHNIVVDRKNLVFYLDREKAIKDGTLKPQENEHGNGNGNVMEYKKPVEVSKEPEVSEQDFIEGRIQELIAASGGKMQKRQAQAKARLEWKLQKMKGRN